MIAKFIFQHVILFLLCYVFIGIAEWEYHINHWTNFGVIMFVLNYCTWSLAITVKTILQHERE